MYEYLTKNNVPFKKCGKLIVGNGSIDQKKKLDELAEKANYKNIDYTVYDKSYMRKNFGYLKSTDNIFVHDTGIFNSHEWYTPKILKIMLINKLFKQSRFFLRRSNDQYICTSI